MVTYKQAFEKSLTVRWKVEPCHQGESCWCRMIVPEEMITYNAFEEGEHEILYLVGSGSISTELAEYIVNLHNKNL